MKSKNEYLNFVESKFAECFNNKNYVYSKPVKITSKSDPTVDFIGSKISPLKHYIYDNNIDNKGIYTIQNCMKLRALKYLLDDTDQIFGSCYKGMGTLTNYNLDKIVYDTFEYLLSNKYLNMDPKDIRIRINSNDSDLIDSILYLKNDIKIDFDSEPIECYKHIYGMEKEQISGRNFNIAIRKNGTDNFFDCAAIIVMETPYKKIGIDMGIGNTSLSMCYFNENNTVASSRIADIIKIDSNSKMRLADSITAVATLLYEDTQNNESKHLRKKLKSYIHIMNYWKRYFSLSNEQINKYISDYLKLEYNSEFDLSDEKVKKILTYQMKGEK